MSDESPKSLYQSQRAPIQALPNAVARFSESRVRRPGYALPALAASLLLGVMLVVTQQNGAPPVEQQITLVPSTGMASLSLPSRPDMPRLAQVDLPSGDLSIPRFSQITIKPNQQEIR